MHIQYSRYILATLLLLPAVLLAQSPELLIPVSAEEEKRLSAANDYFLKKDGYFAKRFRIVRVNTDLLLGDEENLVITLFDDLSIPVVRKKIDIHNDGEVFSWVGQYAQVPSSREAFVQANPELTVERASRQYDYIFDINISGSQYVFDGDPADAEEVPGMRQDPETGRIMYERERLATKLKNGTTFYGVRFAILLVTPREHYQRGQSLFGDEYQLRPLPMDKRYSVIYQIDSDIIGPSGDGYNIKTPEQIRAGERYREFVESLGEDPWKARYKMRESQQ